MKLIEVALNWNPQELGDFIVKWANVSDIWKHINPDWLVTNKSQMNRIGSRYEKALHHFQSGQKMDPPMIGYNQYDEKYPISISDGRHRTAAAVELGQEWIPVALLPEQLRDIKRFVRIK